MLRKTAKKLMRKKLVLIGFAALMLVTMFMYPSIRINAQIDGAEKLSKQAQLQHPSHACTAYNLSDARNMFGKDVVMNNAFLNRETGKFTYDGIRHDDNDITASSCNYSSANRNVKSTVSVTVGIRDTHNQTARDLQHASFIKAFPEEKPIVVEQYNGFYDDTHSGVELRLWAKDKWYEVNAPTLVDAKRVVIVLIDKS